MSIKKREIVKKEIVKSNNLIESSYKLTLSENRLIDLALTKLEIIMLDKNLSAEEVKDLIKQKSFDEIELNIIDYKKEYNIKNNVIYKDMVETAKKLYNRSLIYIEKENLITKRWVITCIYNKERCSINIQFHPDLIPDLMIFKGSFTIFDFDVKKYIRSYYTCRIYELLKQYEKFGSRLLDIDYLRFLLGLDEQEYPEYSNFKQRIIKPAVKEISEITDLYCEFEEIKNKRKVEKIRFKFVKQKVNFQNKSKGQISFFDNNIVVNEGEDGYNLVREFRDILGITISPKQIENLIKLTSEVIKNLKLNCSIKEYIKEKKIIVDKYLEKTKLETTYLTVLKDAIETNWTLKYKLKDTETKDKFNCYENQREYDFDKLEKVLTGQIQDVEYQSLLKD